MAFNFQPIINPSAIQQRANNDFQLSKAGLDSVFGGIGNLANSIAKLGQWKKTMDERDERLKQRNAWDEAYGKTKGVIDGINGEQFDVNSVSRDPFKIVATEGKFVVPEGYKQTSLGFENGDGTVFDLDGIKNGVYADRGFSFSGPTAEGFNQEGYDKAVSEAKELWSKDRDARLKAAQAEMQKYGWNDMNNPAVNAAWEEYVRTGNSGLLTGLQNSYNAELQRKAVEQKLEEEKRAAETAANNKAVGNLLRNFNTALADYNAARSVDGNDGILLAENGKARMANVIDELKEYGYDVSRLEETMNGAVGTKIENIQSKMDAARDARNKRKERAERKWNSLLDFEKTAYDNDFNKFLKEFKE